MLCDKGIVLVQFLGTENFKCKVRWLLNDYSWYRMLCDKGNVLVKFLGTVDFIT